MLFRLLPLLLCLTHMTFAQLNCHSCAGGDFFGSLIFPVLKSLGVPNLIPPAGNCSDNTQKCASTAYCFKRIGKCTRTKTSTEVSASKAHYYSKGCDINAVAGTNVAYQLNKCVKYNEVTVNGYKLTQKICACNKNNLCSGSSPSHAFFTIIVMLIVSLLIIN